jgi:hypothetical protein
MRELHESHVKNNQACSLKKDAQYSLVVLGEKNKK